MDVVPLESVCIQSSPLARLLFSSGTGIFTSVARNTASVHLDFVFYGGLEIRTAFSMRETLGAWQFE